MGEVVTLPVVRIERLVEPRVSSGPREAVMEYVSTVALPVGMASDAVADHMLAWLWREGFKVVPLDEMDLPA